MAYSFKTTWNDAIAEVSTREEYQTARIRIEDPSLLTQSDYDIETGQWTLEGNPLVYPLAGENGQARIIGVRWGVQSGGEAQANATTISAIRIQVPRGAVGRVKKGCKVFVQAAPNPVLIGYVFTVSSDMQGASDAARTFECALDIDSIRAVTPGTYGLTGNAEEGGTLTISTAGWEPADTEFKYQWYHSVPPVPPATEPSVTEIPGEATDAMEVPSGWAGSSVFAVVTGTSPWFNSSTVQTEAVLIDG